MNLNNCNNKNPSNRNYCNFIAALGICLAANVTMASAQEATTSGRNSSLDATLNCSAMTADLERLACYDLNMSRLKDDLSSGNLVAVYKEEIVATRKGLFGIDRIQVPQFLSSQEEISEIETEIVSATRSQQGIWRFSLADGSLWEQIDSANPYFSTRPGTAVRIRRGTLGSYLLTVERSPAIRVSRKR